MSDLPAPATGLQVAQALSVGMELTERMSRTSAALFQANPDIQALYLDTFDALVAEAEGVPGYSTAMAMMLERYAFLWATQKANDMMATPLDPRDYDKVILRFRQLWDGILKARDDRQADDQFRHAFVTSFLRMFVSVLAEEVEADVATRIERKMVERLNNIEVQGTESQRRNRS